MSLMLPNFGAMQSHNLRSAAEQFVERVDFGRQRAVMTGVPHRMAIDLDANSYVLEWQGTRSDDARPKTKPMLDPEGNLRISLEPPKQVERGFQALEGPIGKTEYLGKGVEFAWIETPGGDIDFGEAFITFEGDGTSSYTFLVLSEPGGRELALEILPLADAVRILDEDF